MAAKPATADRSLVVVAQPAGGRAKDGERSPMGGPHQRAGDTDHSRGPRHHQTAVGWRARHHIDLRHLADPALDEQFVRGAREGCRPPGVAPHSSAYAAPNSWAYAAPTKPGNVRHGTPSLRHRSGRAR